MIRVSLASVCIGNRSFDVYINIAFCWSMHINYWLHGHMWLCMMLNNTKILLNTAKNKRYKSIRIYQVMSPTDLGNDTKFQVKCNKKSSQYGKIHIEKGILRKSSAWYCLTSEGNQKNSTRKKQLLLISSLLNFKAHLVYTELSLLMMMHVGALHLAINTRHIL